MKKKPPPGATLIARLKEQRLAREAELARRQSGDLSDNNEQEKPPENKAKASETPTPAVETDSGSPSQAQGRGKSSEKTASKNKSTTVESVIVDVDSSEDHSAKSHQAAARNAKADDDGPKTVFVSTSGPENPVMVPAKGMSAGDLIHREIDIQDLRPISDDYFVLTDEIRLAGRFAAVGLIAQGLRLQKLREANIYKAHYPTFEDYCRKEHQMSATYAYRLVRMAEMADRIAQLSPGSSQSAFSQDAMPDPFEVMIGLGHRHLMALLPLEVETAQELLLKGIPVPNSEDGQDHRVPIGRATEKQIREALKVFSPPPAKTAVRVVEKKSLASEKQLIPALSKLVEMLEDWSLWLGGDAPPELEAARMGRGQLLNRLAKRFRTASGRIADALEGAEE